MNRNITLIAVCAGLALLMLAEWFIFAPSANPSLPARTGGVGTEPTAAAGGDFELPAIEQFAETVERPLFSESRRPGPKDAATAEAGPAPAESPSQLKLSAVVLAPGHKIAVLKNTTTNKVQRVVQGDDWNGWTLQEVRRDGVVLRQQGQEQTLKLVREPGPKTPTPRTPPTQPAARTPPAGPGQTPPPRASVDALKRAAAERLRQQAQPPAQAGRPGAPAVPAAAVPPPAAATPPAVATPPPPEAGEEEVIEETE